MKTLIEPLKREDTASLIDCINTVCGTSPWMSTRCFAPTPAWQHALRETRCGRHLLLVTKADDQVLGWCRLFSTAACDQPPVEGELGIGLREEYRRQGLATTMLARALDWAATIGLQRATLTVHTGNRGAIHLFEQHGFRTTEHRADGCTEMQRQPQSGGGRDNG